MKYIRDDLRAMHDENYELAEYGTGPDNQYNIPDTLIEAVNDANYGRCFNVLELTATGGGCDYVVRNWYNPADRRDYIAVLAAVDDAGVPATLDSEAYVNINYIDNDGWSWVEVATLRFSTCAEAIGRMANMEVPDRRLGVRTGPVS